MGRILGRTAVVFALALTTAACATSEEWAEWKAHTSHFASGSHGFFSVRNRDSASAKKVTRQDVAAARDQGWWGKAITVEQSAILEN